MNKTATDAIQSEQVGNLTLKELAVLLVKHFKVHEGLYEVNLGLQIGIGAVGPTPENAVPGVMVGVSNIGLVKAIKENPHTVDAASVNPLKKPKK